MVVVHVREEDRVQLLGPDSELRQTAWWCRGPRRTEISQRRSYWHPPRNGQASRRMPTH
jgi:hypothetical protein